MEQLCIRFCKIFIIIPDSLLLFFRKIKWWVLYFLSDQDGEHKAVNQLIETQRFFVYHFKYFIFQIQ